MHQGGELTHDFVLSEMSFSKARLKMKKLFLLCTALVVLTLAIPLAMQASAQEPAENAKEKMEEAKATGETPPQPALDKGDNAWILTSSALVLMMTAPGLAMFYGGLVRKKNVVN